MASPLTLKVKEGFRDRKPSPRIRQALLLHATGVAKTKREAAEMAGVNPQTFYMMTTMSEPTKRLSGEIEEMLANEAISTATVIEKLGRKALGKIALLMETGREETQLRAAQDLADRAPQTQRQQQVAVVAPFSIASADVATLAAALVESEKHRREHMHVVGGLVDINLEERQLEQPSYIPPTAKND